MILSGNPFSAVARGVKSGAKSVASVAADPRTQAVANVAAQQYAPQKYAQAQQILSQTQRVLRAGQPQAMPMPQLMPARPMPQQQLPMIEDDMPTSGSGPVQKGNLLLIGGVGIVLVMFLMLRK